MATNKATFFRATWTSLIQAAAGVARVWQRRRVLGRLAALDDRLLADMGITRYDVTSALAEPLFVDPSEKLAERARDARVARRAAAVERLSGDTMPQRQRAA